MELKNKTLGIYGLGRIGMEMAKRCNGAYDMKILYHNRKPNPKRNNSWMLNWSTSEPVSPE